MQLERLTYVREEKELLKKQVAKEIKVVESVYSEWENGKLSIPTRRLVELANFFNVNIDYLLGLSNTRKKLSGNNDIDINVVSKRIKEARLSQDLTMRQLAAIFNTSPSAISNYENGKFLILSIFLVELSKISNYSIDYLLNRTNDKYIKK